MSMYDLTILPKNEVVGIKSDEDLFSQLKKIGIALKSTCGGCASCGQCVIEIVKGEDNLNELPFEEKRLLGNVFHITKERLACQTMITGPVTIDISNNGNKKNEKPSVVKKRSKEEAQVVVAQRKEVSAEKRKVKDLQQGGNKKPKQFNYKEEGE